MNKLQFIQLSTLSALRNLAPSRLLCQSTQIYQKPRYYTSTSDNQDSSYSIRTMDVQDFQTVSEWGNEFDWNSCLEDAEPFLALDPNGFFVAEVDGKPVASMIAVRYDDEYNHSGNWIVPPQARGHGYGSIIYDHTMDYAHRSKIVGMDAVEHKVPAYKKHGFEVFAKSPTYTKKAEGRLKDTVIDLHQVPFQDLEQYDLSTFGYSRKNFLKALLKVNHYHALGVVQDGKLKGYGFLRKGMMGYKVGPLNADSQEIADDILEGLQNFIPGEDVYVEFLDTNKSMIAVLDKQKWKYFSHLYRMFSGGIPKTDLNRTYAVFCDIG